ncbi:hypothetical protein [Brevibacillus antibioticus]|uniref:hypothetical protein n=1 Tax=Brevibacillus antibioticus TaxID=2570228 RepID=UPI00138FF480|nr:hypothetical protein [Brevibacillus antibioticus]
MEKKLAEVPVAKVSMWDSRSIRSFIFAVDMDIGDSVEFEAIDDYSRGIVDAMEDFKERDGSDGFKIGVYGSYYVVKYVDENVSGATCFWQTSG